MSWASIISIAPAFTGTASRKRSTARSCRRSARQIFLTTKSAERSRKGAEADLEKSLRALTTDYLDLWQIHQVSEMNEVEQIFAPGRRHRGVRGAKKAGKCRFIGFTGHHDPEVHLAMLKRYDKYDTILMPLNPGRSRIPQLRKNGAADSRGARNGHPGDEEHRQRRAAPRHALAGLPELRLSLPVHCVPLGCTTVGQIEDDVRIAQQFKPITAEEAEKIRRRATKLAGPRLENWKRDTKQASVHRYWDCGVPA